MSIHPKKNNQFFIGWGSKAYANPPKIDRRMMLMGGVGLVIAGGGIAYGLSSMQMPTGRGSWDMSTMVTLEGVVSNHPFPHIITDHFDGRLQTVMLACEGKCAANVQIDHAINSIVQVQGTLIQRGNYRMLAVKEKGEWIKTIISNGYIHATKQHDAHREKIIDHGEITLSGEILDTKCWYGAMKPARGKGHKACAALCIKGGLPPAIFARHQSGNFFAPIFVNRKGEPHMMDILPFVADPISVTGRLVQIGDMMTFRADLAALQRQ